MGFFLCADRFFTARYYHYTMGSCRMKLSRVKLLRVALLLLLGVMLTGVVPSVRAADSTANLPAKTALDDYIAKADSSYRWNVVKTVKGQGVTAYLIDMTSQTWRTLQEVNRPVWKHWLLVYKPADVKFDTGFLFITGGANDGRMPDPMQSMAAQVATTTHSVTAELRMVPNQPLIFLNDGKPRKEDDLIAYTWDKVMKTGDQTWSARFPMVKSAVRAMDTMRDLMASRQGGKLKVDKFVVAGGSKRGWTTWLTGVADPRVVAIVPMVIDALNCEKSFHHHYASYGFWAPSIGDYVAHKIVTRIGSPESRILYEVEDPYSYRHRLTMPKYIVTASGDQFFLPDSSQFYFDDLQGEKYLRTVPNGDHGLKGTDALPSVIGFYQMILAGKPRPQFTWHFESAGKVRVQCQDLPAKVILWQATNPKARDFRKEAIGPQYKATVLAGANGQYTANVDTPAKGWTAYFVELTYPSVGNSYVKCTTPVRVIPDTYPFADKIIPGTNVKAGL
jgi:PhoPQ-activated pathogenicity-related protein